MSASLSHPHARQANLVVTELQNEVLLYDLDRDQASCLNATAALVWKFADGESSVEEIAARMAAELKTPVDARVVWYALDQLGNKHLLQERLTIPAQYTRMTRRDFLVKAGIAGAIVAIPVIISLTAPTPAMAATGSCPTRVCNNASDCCPGNPTCPAGVCS
jgi:Coenzyme PQQ synthesis protein D (PqqD)